MSYLSHEEAPMISKFELTVPHVIYLCVMLWNDNFGSHCHTLHTECVRVVSSIETHLRRKPWIR